MNEYLMFSMPVVFCIVGIFCAVKKYAIFSRTSIITAIVFFFLNVYRPILNIVQLNRAGYDIHLDGDIIFSLSVMFGISVILYLFGYGLTVLIRNRQKKYHNVSTKEIPSVLFSAGKEENPNEKTLHTNRNTPPTNVNCLSQLGINTPIRRGLIIIFFILVFVGVGCAGVYYFNRDTEIQSPIMVFSKKKTEVFCKKYLDYTEPIQNHYSFKPSYTECMAIYNSYNNLSRYLSPYYIDDDKLESELKSRYPRILKGNLNILTQMSHFDYIWFVSQRYWEDFLGYGLLYALFLLTILAFAYGIGQRILMFCLHPFKKLWIWIKTGN